MPAPVPNTNGLGDPAHVEEYHKQNSTNIWRALSAQFQFPQETIDNPAVKKQIDWYVKHPKHIKKMTDHATPYIYYIFQQVQRRNLPSELVLIPMVESEYNPFAYSHAGAAGLWQMMPGTASGFGLRVNWWYDGRRDIIASTNSALDYLSYLGGFFHKDWLLAIAAYDSGEGCIASAMSKNMKQGKPIDFWHLNLSRETTSYIPKLLALATIIKNPRQYPGLLPPIPNTPYLAKVDVGSQIDLTHAAKLADISLQELSILNPGFNRWATDPAGPQYLLLPLDKAEKFKKELDGLPQDKRVTWSRYKVKSGDTLLKIAQNNQTTLMILENVNHLKNDKLNIGDTLLIPASTKTLNEIVMHSEKHYPAALHHIPEIKITNHIVKKGETLSSIARKYDVKENQICFWNGFRHARDVKEGMKLILWPKDHASNHHTKYQAKNAPNTDDKNCGSDTLKVKHLKLSSDKLKKDLESHHDKTLNKKTLVKNKSIKTKNPKSDTKSSAHHQQVKTNSLKTKKQILITKEQKKIKTLATFETKTITYHIQKGDSLATVAKKFKVSISDLKRWNRIDNPKHLQINQPLIVYANYK